MKFTLLALVPFAAFACKDVKVSYSRDENGGVVDHVEKLGDDITKIDKITKIVMRSGDFGPLCPPFGCFRVIRQLEVTYRMTNGKTQTIRFGKNIDIKSSRVFEIPEGEALTSVNIRTGDYLDAVEFCHSGGVCSGRFGGTGGGSKQFSKSRSVIKAFFHKSGEVVDRLGVHYETDKIIELKAKDPNFVPAVEVETKQVFDPTHVLINDNVDGVADQSKSFTASVSITSAETTTVSTTIGGSASLSLTASAGVDLKVVSASTERTITVGASWSTTNTNSLSTSETITESNTVNLLAPPGYKLQAELYYTQANYEYTWDAPLTCRYSFAPSKVFDGGTISGVTIGYYGIPVIETKYTTLIEPTEQGLPVNGGGESGNGEPVNGETDPTSGGTRHIVILWLALFSTLILSM